MTEATLELGRLAFNAVLCTLAQNSEMKFAVSPRPTICTTPLTAVHGDGDSSPDDGPLMLARLDAPTLGPDDKVGGRWWRMALQAVSRFKRSREGVRLWSRAASLAFSLSLSVIGGAMAAAGRWDLQLRGLGLDDLVRPEVRFPGGSGPERHDGGASKIKNAAAREEAAALAKEADRLQGGKDLAWTKGRIYPR